MLGRIIVVVAQAFLKSDAEKKPSDKAKIMDAATSQCQYKMLISAVMRPTPPPYQANAGRTEIQINGSNQFHGI